MPKRRADYGNWIRRRIVLRFLALGALIAAAAFALGDPIWRGAALAAAAIPLGLGLYLSYLYLRFSGLGGVQRRLWDIAIAGLVWNGEGRALDVGTGQGALAIALEL